MTQYLILLGLAVLAVGCNTPQSSETKRTATAADTIVAKYKTVRLTADLSHLSENERKMVALFIKAAQQMDEAFRQETYPQYDSLMAATTDSLVRRAIEINYGPYDRLDDNKPFIAGVGPKPPSVGYYPLNMTQEAFENADLWDKKSQYTILRSDPNNQLMTLPYHEVFGKQHEQAAKLLDEAALLAEDPAQKKYLELRARALRTDDYIASDRAWLDMKNNRVDVILGPIENYEDKLFNFKTAHEAYVLIKDMAWSKRLAQYAQYLPELQRNLPAPPQYKKEAPGTDSDLAAYDVVYYAGDCNAGSKTIAVNLPNDEQIQLEKGTRRSQLKNTMKAKYDEILKPIAAALMVPEQQKHLTFDAFFYNVMLHEVAHGLGIKHTIDGKGKVREALRELHSAFEEGKADILGVFMVTELHNKKVITEGQLMDYYVTFVASMFRSVRFGAASAHGKANMMCFDHFMKEGAIERDAKSGRYRVDEAKTKAAIGSLSEKILRLQGDGDYARAAKWIAEAGVVPPTLQGDLDGLKAKNIAVDLVFEQGAEVLGLK